MSTITINGRAIGAVITGNRRHLTMDGVPIRQRWSQTPANDEWAANVNATLIATTQSILTEATGHPVTWDDASRAVALVTNTTAIAEAVNTPDVGVDLAAENARLKAELEDCQRYVDMFPEVKEQCHTFRLDCERLRTLLRQAMLGQLKCTCQPPAAEPGCPWHDAQCEWPTAETPVVQQHS